MSRREDLTIRTASVGGIALTLSLALPGCWGGSPAPAKPVLPIQGARIVVGVVGDPAILGTVTVQRGEWEASREASCSILDKALEIGETEQAHVLVFPANRLGELVDAGALAVFPESTVFPPPRDPDETEGTPDPGSEEDPSEADPLRFVDVLPAYRDQVSRYGEDRMALPYGGSALVLVLNREALDRESNKAAAKEAGIALEPPNTWAKLDALAGFFQGRDWDGDGSPEHGIALALGNDSEGVGDATFLARAAALGQHRDHYSFLFQSDSMEPRITTPPFVEALESLSALKAAGPPGLEGFDAEAARAAFRNGEAPLLIDLAQRAGTWGGPGVKLITVAQLPGSEKVYEPNRKIWETAPASNPNRPSYLPGGGGWLVGVAAGAKGLDREAAIDLAKYLISPDISNRVRLDPAFPMLPVRSSQILLGITDPRSVPGVESRPWATAVNKTLLALKIVPGLRVPEASGYLADLAEGRAAAMKGEAAEAALKRVAEAWSARTDRLGKARQLWHYRRSLNALVTTPTPPAREPGK